MKMSLILKPGDDNEMESVCDICYHPTNGNDFNNHLLLSPLLGSTMSEESLYIANTNRLDDSGLVREQILLYFVSKKLLKMGDEQFLELLLCCDNTVIEKKLGEECVKGHEGNKLYFRSFCAKCDGIIKEAITFHKKMLELQKKICKLGEGLRQIICSRAYKSDVAASSCSIRKITKKIESYVMQDFENEIATLSSPANIKAETRECNEDDDFPLQHVDRQINEDHFNDHFEDDSFHDASHITNFHPMSSAKSNEISQERIPAKRMKKGTNNAVASSTQHFDRRQSKFTCKICKMVQKTARGFKNHLKAHEESTMIHGNKYDCPKCKYPALSEWKLRYHLTKAHQQTGRNTCNICGYVGSRRWVYEKHMKEKHGIQVWIPIDQNDNHKTSEVCDVLQNNSISADAVETNEKQEPVVYSCDKCKSVYKTRLCFQRHQKAHLISDQMNHKFDCEDCRFPANSEESLRRHKRKDHQQNLMRTCPLCGHQVKRLDQMKLHMMKKHNVSETTENGRRSRWCSNKRDASFQCHLCKYNYADSGSLKRHLEEHEKSSEMDKKWECRKCGFPCTNENRLIRHLRMKHEDSQPTCSICQKTFKRRYLLKIHLLMHKQSDKSMDPVTGLFCCNMCPDKFKTLRGVILHKAQKHPDANHSAVIDGTSEEETHLCPHCGRCYTTLLQLRKHIRIQHEGIRTHKCDICGKAIEGKAKLEEHMKVHQENRVNEFVCEICGSAYSAKSTLTKHMEKYHSEGSSGKSFPAKKSFKCKFCDVEFPYKYLLEKHLETVHKDKYIFQCDLCEKSYISASSLRLHKEISHGEGGGSHSCEYCGKQFAHKHYVTCHYKWCAVKRKQNADTNVTV